METFNETPTPFVMTFHSSNKEVIGALKVVDGVFSFEGNAEDSAKMFFDFVCDNLGNYISDIIKNRAIDKNTPSDSDYAKLKAEIETLKYRAMTIYEGGTDSKEAWAIIRDLSQLSSDNKQCTPLKGSDGVHCCRHCGFYTKCCISQ
jgi:hypothetical protein